MRWCNDCGDYATDFYKSEKANLCKQHRIERASKRYEAKKEEIRKQQNEYNKTYVKNNRAKYRAKISGRQAGKLKATPTWANKAKIEEFYKKAEQLRINTGTEYQVDHIVPLRSKEVCGLHNEFNLQVIPALENRVKGNKVWPNKANA